MDYTNTHRCHTNTYILTQILTLTHTHMHTPAQTPTLTDAYIDTGTHLHKRITEIIGMYVGTV